MSPTYERLKICGEVGCKNTAYHECFCGYVHPEEWRSARAFPDKRMLTDHMKFLCDDHYDYETN